MATTSTVLSTFRSATRMPWLQLGKTALATILSWLVAGAIFPGTVPVFGAIAALLVVQPSINQSFAKAIERSVGVIAGVLVGSAVGLAFGGGAAAGSGGAAGGGGSLLADRGWVILVAIVVAIAVGWIAKLTPGSAVQLPISAMLVLSVGAVTPGYAFDRIVETIIGAALGVAVNAVIVPPVVVAPAERDLARLARELASALDRLADALTTPTSRADLDATLIEARLLRPMLVKAEGSIKTGDDSLRMNPRRSAHRDRLENARAIHARLTPIVTRVLGMTRAVHDHYDSELPDEPTIGAIAVEIRRAAHDLRLLAQTEFEDADAGAAVAEDGRLGRFSRRPRARAAEPVESEAPHTSEIPALTAPLVIPTPHPEHWILIGSLLEDIRRVREEILA